MLDPVEPPELTVAMASPPPIVESNYKDIVVGGRSLSVQKNLVSLYSIILAAEEETSP